MTNTTYFTAFTSNFNLEPVIKRYFEQHPNGRYTSHEITYQAVDEDNNRFYYLVVFGANTGQSSGVTIDSFILTYVDYHNKVEGEYLAFAINPANQTFPRLEQRKHIRGRLKPED